MLGNLFWVVGTTFAVLASLVAFLVTYNEYRHRFKGWRLWKEALTIGGSTLILFLLISWALAFVLPSVI
jgi:hypothetical protein